MGSVSWSEGKAVASLLTSVVRQVFAVDGDLAVDLPVAQLRVCGILCQGCKSMSALGRELGVSLSAMTQIADRLERAGLVTRVAEEADRRVRCLQLTGRGQQIMQSREAVRIERVMAVFERMPPATRKEVHDALKTLVQASAVPRPKAAAVKKAAGELA
ncbi:MAG: MarR family transcriptional regulator [Thermoguttaceae bacterium]